MVRTSIIVALVATSAISGPAGAQQSVEGAGGTQVSGGCLGAAVTDCLASISKIAMIDQPGIDRQMAHWNDVDVNGKELAERRVISTFVRLPGEGAFSEHLATIYVDAKGAVESIGFSLAGSPESARTTEEYDATRLFDLTSLAIGPACFSDKMALYRFFENTVKPRIAHGQSERTIDDTHAEDMAFDKTPSIAVCGSKMTYSALHGYDTNAIDENNEHGFSALYSLDFELAPTTNHAPAASSAAPRRKVALKE